jgi:hypothetical protein
MNRNVVATYRRTVRLPRDSRNGELAAADKVRRDAFNAAPQRKVRGDGSQYDRYPDGREVEVSS